MAETDDSLRLPLGQDTPEKAFLDRVGHAEDAKLNVEGTAPATSPGVSVMITNRQRAALRELGYSEDAIRQMTPSQAHGKLGFASLSSPHTDEPA